MENGYLVTIYYYKRSKCAQKMYYANWLLSNNLLASEPKSAQKVVVWAKEAREAPAAAVPLPVRSVVLELSHLLFPLSQKTEPVQTFCSTQTVVSAARAWWSLEGPTRRRRGRRRTGASMR